MTRFLIVAAFLTVAIYMVAAQDSGSGSGSQPPAQIPVDCDPNKCKQCYDRCVAFVNNPIVNNQAMKPVSDGLQGCENAKKQCEAAAAAQAGQGQGGAGGAPPAGGSF